MRRMKRPWRSRSTRTQGLRSRLHVPLKEKPLRGPMPRNRTGPMQRQKANVATAAPAKGNMVMMMTAAAVAAATTLALGLLPRAGGLVENHTMMMMALVMMTVPLPLATSPHSKNPSCACLGSTVLQQSRLAMILITVLTASCR
jgi:hypothetical protein